MPNFHAFAEGIRDVFFALCFLSRGKHPADTIASAAAVSFMNCLLFNIAYDIIKKGDRSHPFYYSEGTVIFSGAGAGTGAAAGSCTGATSAGAGTASVDAGAAAGTLSGAAGSGSAGASAI